MGTSVGSRFRGNSTWGATSVRATYLAPQLLYTTSRAGRNFFGDRAPRTPSIMSDIKDELELELGPHELAQHRIFVPGNDAGMVVVQPKNWPTGLVYLTAPVHCRSLSEPQRQTITQKTAGLPEVQVQDTALPSPLVKITPIFESVHPARGQCGLFAARHLKPGAFIIPYLGTVHPDSPSKSDYDLWLDRDAEIAVDASTGGNEARFINDYRGIAQRPNAEFREVWCHRFKQRCMAVFVLSEGKNGRGKGGIGKGDEILVSYGKGFWGHRKEEE